MHFLNLIKETQRHTNYIKDPFLFNLVPLAFHIKNMHNCIIRLFSLRKLIRFFCGLILRMIAQNKCFNILLNEHLPTTRYI